MANELPLDIQTLHTLVFVSLGVCAQLLSCLTLCDPMDCSPPGFSVHGILQQEYCSGLPCLTPGVLLNPGIEPSSPVSPALQADSLSPSQ